MCPCRPAHCPYEQDPSAAPQTTVNTEAGRLAGRQTPGPFPSARSHMRTPASPAGSRLTCEHSLPELHDGCEQHAEERGEAWDVRHQGGLPKQHGGPCGKARRGGRWSLRAPRAQASRPACSHPTDARQGRVNTYHMPMSSV